MNTSTTTMQGTIVQRRCFGQHLSFCTIQQTETGETVALAFRRQDFQHDLGDDFPVKKATLAYGATIQVTVDHIIDTDSRQPRPVRHWKMIRHPHQTALQVARQDEGISCTKYLRTRRQAFDRAQQPQSNKLRSRAISSSEANNSVRTKQQTTDSTDATHYVTSKSRRAQIFGSWLAEHGIVDATDVVLDVAGGKGGLSRQLATNGIRCTVMDPLARRQARTKQLIKQGAPVPTFVTKPFGTDLDTLSLVQEHTCLVGLHPDECTVDILNVALSQNKSVAIVPCCVFPTLFPQRKLDNGQAVRTYEDLIEFLLQTHDQLQRATLPMEGKNQVIYLKV